MVERDGHSSADRRRLMRAGVVVVLGDLIKAEVDVPVGYRETRWRRSRPLEGQQLGCHAGLLHELRAKAEEVRIRRSPLIPMPPWRCPNCADDAGGALPRAIGQWAAFDVPERRLRPRPGAPLCRAPRSRPGCSRRAGLGWSRPARAICRELCGVEVVAIAGHLAAAHLIEVRIAAVLGHEPAAAQPEHPLLLHPLHVVV